jgi:hypothetical protein
MSRLSQLTISSLSVRGPIAPHSGSSFLCNQLHKIWQGDVKRIGRGSIPPPSRQPISPPKGSADPRGPAQRGAPTNCPRKLRAGSGPGRAMLFDTHSRPHREQRQDQGPPLSRKLALPRWIMSRRGPQMVPPPASVADGCQDRCIYARRCLLAPMANRRPILGSAALMAPMSRDRRLADPNARLNPWSGKSPDRLPAKSTARA